MSPRTKEANQQILDARREQILLTAMKVFARRGLAATKISDIASAGELSQGLIYRYFKSKDEIFTELAKRVFSISGIPEYASQLNVSPWEKIINIIDMFISISCEGVGLYYWSIVNQVYTSEAIPEKVKELIERNKSSLSNLIIPIIIEGQKLGQITHGDPIKLYTALYSTLNGMAMQQMRAINFPGFQFSLPDSEIIMRLLKNPEYKYELIIPHNIENRFGQLKFFYNRMSYRFRERVEDDFKIVIITVIETIVKEQKLFRIESEKETGEKSIAVLQAENLKPLSVELKSSRNNTVSKIEYKDNSAFFDFPERNIHKQSKLSGEYYDGYTLPYILQGFPFDSNEKIKITVVWSGVGDAPLGPYGMEIKKSGREIVSVPAGKFDCYQLEMRPGGFGKVLGERYKNYFWYSVNEPRFLVKSENKLGNVRELVKFE